jgi:hypothetical protein
MAALPGITQDQGLHITMTFFDNHTPPRAAKIDTSDRQPVITSPDPTICSVDTNTIAVSADGLTLTFDLLGGLVGTTGTISADCDVNLQSGQDTSVVFPVGEATVSAGAAGQAVTSNVSATAFDKANP